MDSSTSNHVYNCYFMPLPDEVLRDHILLRLPCVDLLARVSYVCRRLYQLMNDDMWQKVAACHFPAIKNDGKLPWKNKVKRELSIIWNDDLQRAIKLSKAREAAEIFHTMVMCGVKPPRASICHFLVARQTEMTVALDILKDMQVAKIETKEKTYAHLLSQCAEKEETQGALTIINIMKGKDFTHWNQEVYEKLCNLCKIQEAQGESTKLENIISALLNPPVEHKNDSPALIAIEKLEKVKRIYLRKLQPQASSVLHLQQDPFHVNLSRLVQQKNVEAVKQLLLNGKQHNRPLNHSYSYELLMNLFLETNNKQQALRVFQEMLDEDIKPTDASLDALFELCWNAADNETTSSLLNIIELGLVEPKAYMYERVMKMFMSKHDCQGVLAVIDQMELRGIKLGRGTDNFYLYPAVMYIQKKSILEAFASLKKVDHLVSYNSITHYIYKSLLKGALKAEHVEIASICVQKMGRLNISNKLIQRFDQLMAIKNAQEDDENEPPRKRQKLEKS